MAKFAKLFDTSGHHIMGSKVDQVLVRIRLNQDTDKVEVVISTNIDGIDIDATLGFETDEDGERCFNDFNPENAIQFIERVLKALESENAERTENLK